MADIEAICSQVRQTAYAIHVYLGHGHLEKVYENALAHRLRKTGLRVEQQRPIQVYDEDGTLIGDYVADVVVEDTLLVELKAARTLAPEHEAQVLGYLKATRLRHALLINFGSYRFQVRKFVWGTEHATPVVGESALAALAGLCVLSTFLLTGCCL